MAALVCLASLGANAADSLAMADFAYTNKLMVAGYTGTETLANFPVLVRLAEYDASTGRGIRGFLYANLTNSKGKDIAFFDEFGNHLASEIETNGWTTSGESLIWVKLPRMRQRTKFYMCYNTTASGAWVTNENPWGDYVGVWHLDETGKTGKTIYDSTTNGLNGLTYAGEGFSSGAIGAARRIAADNSHAYGIVVDATNGVKKTVVDSLGTDFHASFWMLTGNSSDGSVRWGNILGRRKGDLGYSWGFGFGGDSAEGTTINYMRVHSDNTNGNFKCTSHDIGSWLKKNDSVWKKVDLVWKYQTNDNIPVVNIYTNGFLDETMVKHDVPVRLEVANIGIGCSTQDDPQNKEGYKGRRFNGSMDEVRLRPGVVSDDWVKADFDTVNDKNFVTNAPPDTLEVKWAAASGRTGVTNVAAHAATVGGVVEGLSSNATDCTIQGKFWKEGESEPSEWTALKENLALYDEFEVSVPCQEGASYSYKLRAVDDDGGETAAITGAFTVPSYIAVTWARTFCVGVTNVFEHIAVIGGTLDDMGRSTSATVEGKFWHGETEPTEWTTVGEPLSQTGDFSVSISGLMVHMDYSFKLRVVGNSGAVTELISGSFTTRDELMVLWDAASERPGIKRISHGYVVAGATVYSLGDSTRCRILYKLWIEGESEPDAWTALSENLLVNDTCNERIPVLDGTTYRYKFKAVGDSDEETAEVSGSFTTMSAVSDETHYYDDGTNAYWVANSFERYLPFTVTGYTGTETLTNFPVLIDVRAKDTNGFTYDDFYHHGGQDMVFVDDKGHIIPHEIDTWNENGMSLVWVMLPEMVNGTKFTMCYRSPLVDPPADPGNTFEPYIGVWHMNEKENGVVDVIDSTTNNLIGETHAHSTAESNGRVGYARRVAQTGGASSSAGRIIVFDHDNILRDVGPIFTYSGWYKLLSPGTTDPDWAYLVSRKEEDDSKGWGIQYHDKNLSAEKMRVWAADEGKNKSDYFSIKNIGYSHTKWGYWTFVYSNQTFHAYYNGEEIPDTVGGKQLTKFVSNDADTPYHDLVIGGMRNGKGAFSGLVDEARYSKGVRSPDWIKAEYDTMLQVNTPFVAKGDQVGRGQESLVPVVVWEKGADLPDTIIDVSYAYVQFAGTVTFCGAGADTCYIEYQLWADGEVVPTDWTLLLDDITKGTSFSIPIFGLKQDMPYNFRIRAVNVVDGVRRSTREHSGSFRTHGNVNESGDEGDLLRVDNRFVHRYGPGQYAFTTPDYVTNISIIVVGGGGAGGYKVGGGGGGGGVFYSQSYAVTTSTTYRITVGRGGIAATNTTTVSSEGDGEYSSLALESDPSHPLIEVPGGGGGGNYSDGGGAGANGASGGGGTFAKAGGSPTEGGAFGHEGGAGNVKSAKGYLKTAAGGGGGAGRGGLPATSDNYYFGGAGGVGIACSMLGETLYFGAGGGGGYKYFVEGDHYSGPGEGGSGIGGNAADVRNKTLATSGVEHTGAGGGGGSMTKEETDVTNQEEEETFWQGGHGGDGVVMISYEVHGRDPIAEEPRISMTHCVYDENTVSADIGYRVYWAGIQNDLDDIYIHYSTVGPDELTNSAAGGWVKVDEGKIGVGSATFVPPELGYTYWVCLVARKDANSFAYSDEFDSFYVPAIELDGVTWKKGNTAASDHAQVVYRLHETNETTHLYCYWSASREALTNNAAAPSGDGVHFMDLGTGMSGSTEFNIPASEGLARNGVYYVRLGCGDERGLKLFLSAEIRELNTVEMPSVIFSSGSWDENSYVTTAHFTMDTSFLDPADTELLALYSKVQADVKADNAATKATVVRESLGSCAALPNGVATSAGFPLVPDVATNFYVRLALYSAVSNTYYYSDTREIVVTKAVENSTLLIVANANPKRGCYGDAPLPLDYVLTYGGLTNGPGRAYYDEHYGLSGELGCEVTATSPVGQYDITKGTLTDSFATYEDFGTGLSYYYQLLFTGAKYTITNAVFTASIEDFTERYTGEPCDVSALVCTTNGIRNEQPVTFLYRVGSGEWSSAMPSGYTDVGNYMVQFKASAPNHDDVRGTFKVTIEPVPLSATIAVTSNLTYTGSAQTPPIATNVTGLVRGDINALTCEFRDESGEWSDTVPSFTVPGTYKLFFRVSAPNHATFVTNCTFTIEGWDYKINMDGATGYNTPINISDPGWLIKNSPYTGEQLADRDTRYADLDMVCGNGLKYWQNYVIGRTNLNQKLIATIMQSNSRVQENCFIVRFSAVQALRNTGLDVKFRLDRKLKGTNAFALGELSEKYEMNVPLGPDDPTVLYVFNVVLTPTNELYTGQSVLSSITTIGVVRVMSTLTNTVTAVPWGSMTYGTETNAAVMVADVLNPNGLSKDDAILAYDTQTRGFRSWKHVSGNNWESITSVTKGGLYESSANETCLDQGNAFWLVRSNPSRNGEPVPFYLIGRYTGEDYVLGLAGGSAETPGHTLVANPTFNDVDLNRLVFVDGEGHAATPANGDRIIVQGESGLQTEYFRYNGAWGCNVITNMRGRIRQVWTPGGKIPSGTGFWYKRTGDGALNIKFGADE